MSYYKIRNKQDTFRAEELSLLLAESYAESKDKLSARIEFEHANNMFGSAEVRARYALWAAGINDFATAKSLRADLENDAQHWNKYSCSLYKPLLNSIDEALTKHNNP